MNENKMHAIYTHFFLKIDMINAIHLIEIIG